jgi:hypothetical protein
MLCLALLGTLLPMTVVNIPSDKGTGPTEILHEAVRAQVFSSGTQATTGAGLHVRNVRTLEGGG